MKISLRHTFACTPEEFWASYWDPEFDAAVQRVTGIGKELLQETHEGAIRVRRQRFTSTMKLPAAVASMVGTDKVAYEQQSRIDDAAGKISWEVFPPVLPDKIAAKGVLYLEVNPAGGVTQVIDGDVTVKIPLVGSKLEASIVDTISKGYDGTAKLRILWFQTRASGDHAKWATLTAAKGGKP